MYIDKDGYVILSIKGKKHREHRYVWEQTHGNIPNDMQIHHINGKKDDNRLENLAMVTGKENRNKSDCWGRGWKNTNYGKYASRPKTIKSKVFGTICGAIMHTRLEFVGLNH